MVLKIQSAAQDFWGISKVNTTWRMVITIKLLDFVHRPDFYKQKTQSPEA
jgi:hypothetical protein